MPPAMSLAIEAVFGSVENWCREFASLLAEPPAVAGWALLVFVPGTGALANVRIRDPHSATKDTIALLAFPLGASTDAAMGAAPRIGPSDVFIDRIDWARVHERYQTAVAANSDHLGAGSTEVPGARLVDVRRAEVFEQADSMLPGAQWRDPRQVREWAGALADGPPVIVYCVHGHEVSRATAMRLNAAGVTARFLRGGIEAWKAAGKAVQAKERTT